MEKKAQHLYVILTGIFITNALLAEIIGVKIFSLESTLGLNPANIPLFGGSVLDFNLTAGVIIWPVVFLTTDVINEYFGKKGVRKVSYLTVALISYMFVVIVVITKLEPAQFWLDVNSETPEGGSFNVDFAFNKIFAQGLGIIVGSLIAFLIGQLLDVFVFQKLKRMTKDKMIWLRATGSTLVSQFVDSFVVLFIAFFVFGNWSIDLVISVGVINYIYKFCVAVLLTPLIYLAHHLIDRYLGKELSGKMRAEATENSHGLF